MVAIDGRFLLQVLAGAGVAAIVGFFPVRVPGSKASVAGAETTTDKDPAGNTTTTTWSFTVDGTAPTKTSTSPADGTTVQPPATVSASYDQALDHASSTLTV